MTKNQINLQKEMDYWVKDMESKITKTNEISVMVKDNAQNIDFNYELIKQLQKEMENMKKEITRLKHFNLIAMKSRPLKDLSQ